MSRLDQLRHLAGLLGIATRHVDALGVVHEPGEETLSRLVESFGLPAEPDHAAALLAEEANAAPLGLSAAQIVAAEEGFPEMSLRLPPGILDAEWHCSYEAGGASEGRSDGATLRLPGGLPVGYHRLAVVAGGVAAETQLIVAPATCHLPEGLRQGARSWGLTAQLYSLRSAENWGIGDFADLARLGDGAGALGAATVGINPLHALFAAEPRHCSPYSPSSRLWLDWLYIDVTAAPGFAEDTAAQALAQPAALAAARESEFVDYAAVAALKRPVLQTLFRRFVERDCALSDEFRAFQQAGGAALAQFATFEALHEHFLGAGGAFSWLSWPAAMRDPQSPAVAEFARDHGERVGFFQFLQWLTDRQLARAAAAGQAGGLGIGLYRDLAVGVNPNGAEAWADQELVAPGAAIGAPPDTLSRAGQNWGLAPFSPLALRRRGFAPLIAALRANMRHAGILRMDHVMALQRLYWVPNGSPATDGAYVGYPFGDMLRILALESRRHRCAVIGEDLGTVPDGFRARMQAADVLSYRVVMFERHGDGSFAAPAEYPPLAAASAATHDLATLKGFWLGHDIEWRRRLGTYPDAAAEAAEQNDRRRDRYMLLEALAREGLVPPERFGEFIAEEGAPSYSAELGDAILVYLARSQARLALIQIEDVAGEIEQANLPGTSDAHPNWRRRLSLSLEVLRSRPETSRLAARIGKARRQSAGQPEG
jgi:4-alpha-glucanotransferase